MEWLAWGLCLLFTGVLLIAVLERLIGRPIPQFRHSRPIERQRIYWLVPLAMLASAFALLIPFSELLTCSDCSENWAFAATLLVSTALGWLLYYTLLVFTFLKRLVVK